MSLGLENNRVVLLPHDPDWADEFKKEAKVIERLIGKENVLEVHHIGSTSIPGIVAKPLMGIMVEVDDLRQAEDWKDNLKSGGYNLHETAPDHLLFAKGSKDVTKVHLYFAKKGSEYLKIALTFRDYLLDHPETSKEYENLKKSLAAKFPNDRKSYGLGKNDYIRSVITKASA